MSSGTPLVEESGDFVLDIVGRAPHCARVELDASGNEADNRAEYSAYKPVVAGSAGDNAEFVESSTIAQSHPKVTAVSPRTSYRYIHPKLFRE